MRNQLRANLGWVSFKTKEYQMKSKILGPSPGRMGGIWREDSIKKLCKLIWIRAITWGQARALLNYILETLISYQNAFGILWIGFGKMQEISLVSAISIFEQIAAASVCKNTENNDSTLFGAQLSLSYQAHQLIIDLFSRIGEFLGEEENTRIKGIEGKISRCGSWFLSKKEKAGLN